MGKSKFTAREMWALKTAGLLSDGKKVHVPNDEVIPKTFAGWSVEFGAYL
jgi:hypothetical protein